MSKTFVTIYCAKFKSMLRKQLQILRNTNVCYKIVVIDFKVILQNYHRNKSEIILQFNEQTNKIYSDYNI